jgi:uncharacterized membrane protein
MSVPRAGMSKGRLEAFSDGVLAVIITIMVLELSIPHGSTFAALVPLFPVILAYALSFIYVGIYWNNHHHMLHATQHIDGSIMWANLHLLFWLSLIPFVTGWCSENHFAALPVAMYGVVLLMAAVAYTILQTRIIRHEGAGSLLGRAVGRDNKGKVSLLCYAVAIPSVLLSPWIAVALYVLVALIWLVPDTRIEKA